MVAPKNAVNYKIIADCVNDVSGGSVYKIKYKKPGGTTGEWVALLGSQAIDVENEEGVTITYEANTYLYYDTQSGDLDTKGDWCVQAYVEIGALKVHGVDYEGKKPWALLRVLDTL